MFGPGPGRGCTSWLKRRWIQSPWPRATALVTVEREGIRSHRSFAVESTQDTVTRFKAWMARKGPPAVIGAAAIGVLLIARGVITLVWLRRLRKPAPIVPALRPQAGCCITRFG